MKPPAAAATLAEVRKKKEKKERDVEWQDVMGELLCEENCFCYKTHYPDWQSKSGSAAQMKH